jgi:hypothetical protein
LNEPSDPNDTLLVHTAARTASWFPGYLTLDNVTKIVGLLGSNTPVKPVVLPLLFFLLHFLHTPEHLEVIIATSRTTILNCSSGIGQTQADDIYTAFKELIQEPPPCIHAFRRTHEHLWNGVVESVKEILDPILARTLEDSARSVLRWNGRTRIPAERRDVDLRLESSGRLESGGGNVPLESDAISIQDIERQYSCAASWAM